MFEIKQIAWNDSMGNLLDTSAWIEFFEGTPLGLQVKELIKHEQCYTCCLSLAEIVSWCLRNRHDIDFYIETVEKNSTVLTVKKSIILTAGEITFERKKRVHNWGIMVGFIYATAQAYGLQVITKDPHFKGLLHVRLLE